MTIEPRRDFRQIEWDERCTEACRELARLTIREDLGREYDWTTLALVPLDAQGHASIVAREEGVIAGLPAVEVVLTEYDPRLVCEALVKDGTRVLAGQAVAHLRGPARTLLTAERTVLNFLGRLSGVATLSRRYVDAVAGTQARIYDTRKTTPGWRLLEKYAVRVGGGCNHRLNLYEAILIKDNHLAVGADSSSSSRFTPAEAVAKAKTFLAEIPIQRADSPMAGRIVEVEVDNLGQLDGVLAAAPDIVLLDNMQLPELREAVARRDRLAPLVELEASGGVDLSTVTAIAQTGVERISVGALTHAAQWLDVALDWQ
jgi:nicotinate-nucleotide pyrophosphorylase (carboxylating)